MLLGGGTRIYSTFICSLDDFHPYSFTETNVGPTRVKLGANAVTLSTTPLLLPHIPL